MAKTRKARKRGRRSTSRRPDVGTKRQAVELAGTIGDLTLQMESFVRLYDAYLGNGARAYADSHPDCKSYNAACVGASVALRIPKVREKIDALRLARYKRMQMEGDEALALVAMDARADIRGLYDHDGKLLPPHLWPDDIAASVEAVDVVNGKVKLASKSAARRTVLEQTGRIKGVGEGLDSLAKILAGNFEEEAPK